MESSLYERLLLGVPAGIMIASICNFARRRDPISAIEALVMAQAMQAVRARALAEIQQRRYWLGEGRMLG